MPTVDNLTLKIQVEGSAQLKDTTAEMQKLDSATAKTGSTLKNNQQNIRNVAFQVQDLAVQIAGGTSAFVALGQQIPQLLGGFGVLGAVIGAVAAVGIPLLSAGIRAVLGETKDLDQTISDAKNSVDRFNQSQRTNITTVQSLGTEFGNLTSEAKRFYETKETIDRLRAFLDLRAAIVKVKQEYGFLNDEIIRRADQSPLASQFKLFGDASNVEAIRLIEARLKSLDLGLTIKQFTELGNKLRELDANAPEKNLAIITDISQWLTTSVKDTADLNKIFKEIVYPLLDINQLILEFNRNVKEAGDKSVRLAFELGSIQERFLPQIGDAKRSFNEIAAARLESEMRVQAEIANLGQRTDLDERQKKLLLIAFTRKEAVALGEVEKNIAKAQWESYRGAYLSNEAKLSQLDLDKRILQIQRDNLGGLDAATQYEIDLARNAQQYEQALLNISEQVRKRTISQEQGNQLEREALLIKEKTDQLAQSSLDKKIRELQATKEQAYWQELITKAEERRIGLDTALNELMIRGPEQARRANEDYINSTLSDLDRKLAEISRTEQDLQRSILARIAAQHTAANGEIIDPEGYSRAVQQIIEATNRNIQIRQQQARMEYEHSRSFSAGWTKAYREYRDAANNAAEQAKNLFNRTVGAMEDLFVNFAKTGKFEWKKFVQTMGEELLRSQLKKLISDIFGDMTVAMNSGEGFFGKLGSILGMGGQQNKGGTPTNPLYVLDVNSARGMQMADSQARGGGGGGFFSDLWSGIKNIGNSIGNIFSGGFGTGSDFGNLDFGGFFANGGTIPRGRYGIVGERGPEYVAGPATVSPMMGTNVTYNINAVDAASFRSMIAADPSFIHAVAMQGGKGLARRY